MTDSKHRDETSNPHPPYVYNTYGSQSLSLVINFLPITEPRQCADCRTVASPALSIPLLFCPLPTAVICLWVWNCMKWRRKFDAANRSDFGVAKSGRFRDANRIAPGSAGAVGCLEDWMERIGPFHSPQNAFVSPTFLSV